LFGGDVTAPRKISGEWIVGFGERCRGAIRDISAKGFANGDDRNRRRASDDGEAQDGPCRLALLLLNVVCIRCSHHWNIRMVVGR
jgi:hypothetical protein